ncbi:toll/interleukin-1 receptor domain-containing protein [Thiothrix lacustris]|uniref:Toll/interleukin-1 receptor domain-containing protein n=2 Tax=Thiothrix TaxID=1030 RepID=A0ABY9MMT2_9GAMM|nr:toll/interleukin-1 receptor domain-containing protein [Thiothrix lacustris]WML89936.1 toll/interleukin-1 receptor domain-containing protein [Thiothrix lacustris]
MTKVFISYSHDSDAHRERVRKLSDRLRTEGIDCDIDQYDPTPNEGWPLWMLKHIQDANYVLLICTETYQKRVEQREEPGKGLGVRWEGMLLLNQLYRNQSLNTKFIPVIFRPEDEAFIPDPVFGFSRYNLSHPREYDNLYRHIRGELGADKPPLGAPHFIRTIHSNSLPTVEGKLFGRKDELALLDKAWADPQTRVVQFIAPGGTGKTKLLRHWLDHTDNIEALIAWSFYSQGSSEDKQISATPFFSHSFNALHSDKTTFSTEEEKGEHLAHLLRQQRCLLVLDGLEPLQHAGRGMRGELKDRAIRQLLKNLAGEHTSLCIITTRLAVHELCDRAHTISHDLQNLAVEDGIDLLKYWKIRGSDEELKKAVQEYGCHALALHLLGNALHTYLDGDVRKRDTLDELIDDYDDAGRHAFKVMQAYREWLSGTPELQLLHLLGLFDHPIETDVLQVLWQSQIPNLTAGIAEKAWKVAIRDLREKHRMLSAHEGRPDLLDCHPLIREYFGKQLQTQHPDAWQQAHERLYEYYKALPEEEFPDTLEEMQPLFSAVAHGCAAGLHQQAMWIYSYRVQRGWEQYLFYKFSASSDSLSTLSSLFSIPWSHTANSISQDAKAALFNWVANDLSSLGRLNEAVIPMSLAAELRFKQRHWEEVELNFRNLSELHLFLGNINESIEYAEKSIYYGKRHGSMFSQMASLTTLAHSLHQASEMNKAKRLYQQAEQIQKNQRSYEPYLYSIQGFHYCDLLLELEESKEASIRITESLRINQIHREMSLVSIALTKLSHAQLFSKQQKWVKSLEKSDEAISHLHLSGVQKYLPYGLLARAALFRKTRDFDRARQDLQEVFDIAEPSGMRLHLTDYHLEMARLILAEEEEGVCNTPLQETDVGAYCIRPLSLQSHIAAAARLITETGYHRRDAELAKLQQYIG